MIAFFRLASSEEMQKIDDDDAVHICGFLGLNSPRSQPHFFGGGKGCGTEDSSTLVRLWIIGMRRKASWHTTTYYAA